MLARNSKWRGEKEKKKRERKSGLGMLERGESCDLTGMTLEGLIPPRLEENRGGGHVATWEKGTCLKPVGQRVWSEEG